MRTLVQDLRYGMRMLVKHRGLTLVGGFAMTQPTCCYLSSQICDRSWFR